MSRSLLIANDFPPVTSGIATVFSQLWRLLPPERTWIAAPSLPGAEDHDAQFPVEIRRIPLPLGENGPSKIAKTLLTTTWALITALSERPARIHCGQVLSSGLAGWLCKRLLGIPYTVWVYGSETARLAKGGRTTRLMQTILNASEQVITNSEQTSREFLAFGVPQEKIRCIYPGVDPRVFYPLPPDPARIEQLGLQNKKVLLTLARLDQRKGHDTALRALASLNRSDIVYLIGGKGREEPRLRELTSQLGLESQVRFLGFVPDADLPTIYNLCDIFVMPNRVTEGTQLSGDIEGFGISFIEAGACGKPVIAGRSGGAVEAVLDEQTGLLVDPRTEIDTAAAITRLLDEPGLSATLGAQARQRIQREFDWRILARQLEEIL